MRLGSADVHVRTLGNNAVADLEVRAPRGQKKQGGVRHGERHPVGENRRV